MVLGQFPAVKADGYERGAEQEAHQHDPLVGALVGIVHRTGHGAIHTTTRTQRNLTRVLTLLLKVTNHFTFELLSRRTSCRSTSAHRAIGSA